MTVFVLCHDEKAQRSPVCQSLVLVSIPPVSRIKKPSSASPSKGGNQRPATVSIMGRAAIGTSFREDKTARKVTLSKRKKGLYKKSQELAQVNANACHHLTIKR
mgnify:CR=1 FL=1